MNVSAAGAAPTASGTSLLLAWTVPWRPWRSTALRKKLLKNTSAAAASAISCNCRMARAAKSKAAMTPSSINARRWRRYKVELPVQVIFRKGGPSTVVPGYGTDISRGGMALDAEVSLKRGDLIEVDFQTPSRLHVTGIIRNRSGHRFGIEFLTPLLS